VSACVNWLDLSIGLGAGILVILVLELFCWYLGDKCN
jgi:hypothetical protein